MLSEISYTIIIPHKNTPKLLQRCLDSIPQREDIQTIVVDDNSDPQVTSLKNFPGLNAPRTEVIFTKEGKGAGYARNIGLKKAIGKWVLFADADDFFTSGFLEHLNKYKDSIYDLIYFGINRVSKKNEKKSNVDQKYDNLMKNAICKQEYDAYKYTAYVPWGKIIRVSFIKENNILFDETMVANDKMFSIKTAHYAKNIYFDATRIYTYVPEHGFLTQVKTTVANFDRFCVYVRMNRFFESISQEKYRINLIPPLKNLIDIQNMKYFWEGIKLLRENGFNLYDELFRLARTLPKLIFKNKG